jgi:hypothetical protein
MAVGFVLAYAFWGAILYREFGNPFFPYFNAIFKSPHWEPAAFFDERFGPRSLTQALAFPFLFSRQSLLVSEISFRDYRLAFVLGLSLLCLGKFLFLRVRRQAYATVETTPDSSRFAWRLVAVFTLVAYLVWMKLFSIYRYLVPLELLSGLLIVVATLYLAKNVNVRRVAIVLLALLILGTTRKMGWERTELREAYFNVTVPAVPRNALVIMGSGQPMAYVIPFFPADARFVSPVNNFLGLDQTNLLERKIAETIRTHEGPLFSLDYRGGEAAQPDAMWARLGLRPEGATCARVLSNIDNDAMQLCRLNRIPR